MRDVLLPFAGFPTLSPFVILSLFLQFTVSSKEEGKKYLGPLEEVREIILHLIHSLGGEHGMNRLVQLQRRKAFGKGEENKLNACNLQQGGRRIVGKWSWEMSTRRLTVVP